MRKQEKHCCKIPKETLPRALTVLITANLSSNRFAWKGWRSVDCNLTALTSHKCVFNMKLIICNRHVSKRVFITNSPIHDKHTHDVNINVQYYIFLSYTHQHRRMLLSNLKIILCVCVSLCTHMSVFLVLS